MKIRTVSGLELSMRACQNAPNQNPNLPPLPLPRAVCMGPSTPRQRLFTFRSTTPGTWQERERIFKGALGVKLRVGFGARFGGGRVGFKGKVRLKVEGFGVKTRFRKSGIILAGSNVTAS